MITEKLPPAEQCSARAKATGEQCMRRVVGGGPCRMHGGAAAQVVAARERRIAAWQAGQAGADLEDRPAHEALADAAGTADRIVRQLRRKLDSGELDPAQLELLGPWLDRTGRLSKAVMDGNVDERRVRLSELQTIRVVEAIRLVLMRAGVDDTWATAHMVQAALAEVSGSASRPVVQAQVLSASTDRPIREEPT